MQRANRPQRANRGYTGRPRAPPQNPRKPGNPLKIIFREGLGPNQLAQRPPGYHTIHLGHGIPHILDFGTIPPTKPCSPGPHFGTKNVPGPARARFSNPGSKFWPPGPKSGPRDQTHKMCAPKTHAQPCPQKWKPSHMVQVMARNHSGANQANPGQARPHKVPLQKPRGLKSLVPVHQIKQK